MRDESAQWLRQAEGDFKAAKDNLESENFYVVAFLCHQSVEKGLKALFIVRNARAPPKTHSLRRLSSELAAPVELLDAADLLEPVYTESRYPDILEDVPLDRYSRSDAGIMIKIAEDFFTWIQEQMLLS